MYIHVSNQPAVPYAHSYVLPQARARARAPPLLNPRYSTQLCGLPFAPAVCNCLRAYMPGCTHRHGDAKYLDYSAFADPPSTPIPSTPAARVDGWLAAFMRPRARNWKASSFAKGETEGGHAAVTDKRKSVSEGNPIGGRRRRDVPASLVRPRSAGRGDAGLEGLSHPWQRLPEGKQGFARRQESSMAATRQPLDTVELSPTTTTAATATTTTPGDARHRGRYRLPAPALALVDLARFVRENTSGVESSIVRLIAPLASPFERWFSGENVRDNSVASSFFFLVEDCI